jgi:hypothetical protein
MGAIPVKAPAVPPASCSDDCVKSIDFNRLEYDPAGGKAPVMLTIVLKQDMDQQQTVTVNGLFIPRVRDNFGRAVSSGGSGGVLEAQGSLVTNSWIPTRGDTMLLALDAGLFNDRFPRILLSSPRGASIDVSKNNAAMAISGLTLNCLYAVPVPATEAGTPAAADRRTQNACAPSLGFKKASSTNLQIARWIEPNSAIDRLSITTLDVAAPGAVTTASGLPSVQVISDRDAPAWGPNPEVYWLPSEKPELRPLTCVPGRGSRLVCDAPDKKDMSLSRDALTLEVIDQGHPGGPIKGLISTLPCGGAAPASPCRQPLLWKTNPPKLVPTVKRNASSGVPDLGDSSWTLTLQVVNVDGTDKPTLRAPALPQGPKPTSLPEGRIECSRVIGRPCVAIFTIYRSDLNALSDLMEFNVSKPSGETFQPYQITNILTGVRPWLSQVADDFTYFYGENLVYDAIKINATEITTPDLQCMPDGTYCAVVKPYDSTQSSGLVYFVSHMPDVAFPLVKVNAATANAPITYKKPAATDPKAAPGKVANTITSPDSTELQLLFKNKAEFAIQAYK